MTDPEAADPTVESERWRDRAAGIAFVIHMILFLLASAYGIIRDQISIPDSAINMVDGWFRLLAYQTGLIIGVSCLLTVIGHFLIRLCPRGMIHFVNVGLVLALAAWSLLVGIYSSVITGVLYGILGTIVLIVYICNMKDVEVTTALLVHVNHLAQKYHSLFSVVMITSFVAHVYSSLASVAITVMFGVLGLQYERLTILIAIYYILSLWWTAQVILNVVRTIVAGTVGLDYERRHRKYSKQPDESSTVNQNEHPEQKVVWQSTAMTFAHIGGVCYGSLLVGPISFIRGIFGIALKLTSIRSEPILQTKENLDVAGRNFNYLAFNHVALRGEPYKVAANSVWDLMQASQIGQVAGDSSIGSFSLFFSSLVGLLAAFTDLAFKIIVYNFKLSECMASFVGFWLLALIIPELYLKIIDAGATALLVCVADEPHKLQTSGAQLYDIISQKYPKVLEQQSL